MDSTSYSADVKGQTHLLSHDEVEVAHEEVAKQSAGHIEGNTFKPVNLLGALHLI